MAENDLTVKQVGATPADTNAQPQEKTETPKKVQYNIGAAMLAAENGGIGAGIEAGVEKKIQLKNGPTYIDFKADAGLYTSGAKRADVYTGLKVEHNSEYKYRPIVTDMGIEARYLQNNSERSLTTQFGENHKGYFKTDYHSQNLQLNQKFGMEYATKNNKFTLGAGIKGGVNIPLDDGFKLEDTYVERIDEEITTPDGIQTATTVNIYNSKFERIPETEPNLSGYVNADYKINKKLSLGLSSEYGTHNKEIKFGAKYNF